MEEVAEKWKESILVNGKIEAVEDKDTSTAAGSVDVVKGLVAEVATTASSEALASPAQEEEDIVMTPTEDPAAPEGVYICMYVCMFMMYLFRLGT